jgi:nucleotide-binding universal stress UspA family protein
MNEIVVGVDGSATAHRAARRAAELAAACGVGLHLVTTVRRHGKDLSVGGESWHIDSFSAGEQLLESLTVELSVDPISKSVQTGDPANVLCAEAERLKAQMIVVGNRRVQTAGRVLGSVATQVARHAPCDVLIANTAGADASDGS